MSAAIGGERPPPQSTVRRRFTTGQTVALFTIGTGLLIAVVFWRDGAKELPAPAPTPQASIRQLVRPEMLEPPRPVPVEPVAMPAPPPPLPVAPPPPAVRTALPPATPAAPRRRLLSYSSGEPQQPATAPAPAAAPGTTGTTVGLAGQALPGARAGAALDTTLMLMPGVYGCTLDTAVSSDVSGPFICHTARDIRSPAGIVLMERGTRIVGQYQSVRVGNRRVPALSVVAYTPHGVPVPLGAPMADALGRVGLDGEVDTHFWQRFGGATLLLLTQGAMGAAQAALQSGSGNTYLNLGGGGYALQAVIAETLRGSVNLPPTITKHQGEEVSFFVTAPISFADAYRLRVE